MVCLSPMGYGVATGNKHTISIFVDQTHIQHTRPLVFQCLELLLLT